VKMGEISIRVQDLGKKYEIGVRPAQYWKYNSLRETLSNALTTQFRRLWSRDAATANSERLDTFWALKDVSFEVQRGEVLGIIGRNGAGKSTLLKILSRITEPTEGSAEIHGRVGSLLEVGTGFHPELTGRENIYLNGSVLGMKKAEIERKFHEIVEFAEIGKFLDTPVKRYSSGMHVRLAFAVAAHLEPEILLVDEVLAVGDVGFQKKCMGQMREVGKGGRTILFVSHNMGAIAELCPRAILLDLGRIVADSKTSQVLAEYSALINTTAGASPHIELERDSSLPCSIFEVSITDVEGSNTGTFDLNDDIVIVLRYVVREVFRNLILNVTLARDMIHIINSFDTDNQTEINPKDPGVYLAKYKIPRMFLKAGLYSLTVGIGTPERCFQLFHDVLHFQVEEWTVNTTLKGYRRERLGHVVSPAVWETERLENVS